MMSPSDRVVSEPIDRVEAVAETDSEPIAIIGVGCRFPGARNAASFWQLLRQGMDAVTEVPVDRWDVDAFDDRRPGTQGRMNTRWGGFLERIDEFDFHFFGISPREAVRMDPQQRLLLEVGWEALEDAGLVPERLVGTQTGVFIGLSSNDYGRAQMFPSLSDAYMASGNACSMAANRVSYAFNFQGPSMAVDTACSSALVAVHLACCSLWNGETTQAMAGGVNVILSPAMSMNFSQAGMLSPDGRCKAFDARANGYVRSEGAGIVVLKPLSRALAEGNPIYALIRGSAVNQDGHTNGLTVPSQQAQEAVVLEACRRARVSPGQIDYIEAHGTGTPVGDPIEAKALGTVLAIDRSPGRPCAIGSCKTNIGHAESAAGIAGLIKVAFMLKHREIPPSLHFHEPNPQIRFDELPLRIQTVLGPWPARSIPGLAGVNSFGFGGTNAHVVLQQAPTESGRAQERDSEGAGACLLALSAHSPRALADLARKYRELLTADEGEAWPPLNEMCYTASVRRCHHDHRLALVAHSREDLTRGLGAFLEGAAHPGMTTGQKNPDHGSKLVFVFPGQGTQWWAMGRQLLEQQRVFRATMEQCDELLHEYAGWSLLDELSADECHSRLGETEIAQPALLALQVALATLWRSWGIVPDAVVGHSVGEVAAAHVAGALSLEDAVWAMFHRGRLMQRAAGQGKMAAVNLSRPEAERALAGYEDQLAIAAYNSPTTTVLSGDPTALEEVLQAVQQRGILVRPLWMNFAFHSSQMEPFQRELVAALQRLRPRSATFPIFSTVTGQAADGREFDAAYWARNIREPVFFSAAIEKLLESGHDIFLELSPHPTLSGSIGQCLRHHGKEGTLLPSLRREKDEQAVLLGTLGALYTRGYAVDWNALFPPGGRVVPLPSYPWQRERCWLEIDEADMKGGSWLSQSNKEGHPLVGRHLKSAHPVWEIAFDRRLLRYLDDHRVQGTVALPGTAFVEMALATAKEAFGTGAHMLTELEFQRVLFLPESAACTVQLVLCPGAGGESSFHIYSRTGEIEQPFESWTLHATGKIRPDHDGSTSQGQEVVALEEIRARCQEEVSHRDFYLDLRERGLQFGPCFQAVEQSWRRDGETLGRLRVPEALEPEIEAYQLHPAILDACFQGMVAAVPDETMERNHGAVYLPVRIDRIRLHDRPGLRLWSHVRLRPRAEQGANTLVGDIRVLDEAGRLMVEVSGLRLQQVDRSALPDAEEDVANWFHELVWERKARPGQEVMHLPSGYLLTPRQITERMQPQLTGMSAQLKPYRELGSQLEVMGTAYVLKGFQELGWQLCPRQRVSSASLAEQLGVASQHRRYLGRLLERLGEEGVLKNVGSEWEVCRAPNLEDPEALWKALLVECPACEAELTLMRRCGRQLAKVLRGECDPLQLLFPAGALTAAEQLYQDSPFSRAYNSLIRDAICVALERLPRGRTVRILEIGAGTGGLTAYVLPRLPMNQTEYVFTDVSGLFSFHAQQKFHDYPFVRYQLLDIEGDLEAQGFAAHSFDMILASHVPHATRNLRKTLRNVRQLLSSEGLMVLLEGEELHGIYDLVFAMTEGWWKFDDLDLRPTHPLLSRQQWPNVLEDVGFTEAVVVPHGEDGRERDWSRQIAILARGPCVEPEAGRVETAIPPPERKGSWLIFTDTGDVGQNLAILLASHGERCVMVSPGDDYERLASERYRLNPARPEDFYRLIEEALGSGEPPCRGVVHFWSLEATPPDETTVASLEAAQELGCGSVLHTVQAIAKVDPATSPRLWLVTRGAQLILDRVGEVAGPQVESVSVAQSPLWGLGRVIALEHSELCCTNVDLSATVTPEEIRSLFYEFWSDDHEDQIVLRGNARYVRRIVPASPEASFEKRRVVPVEQPFCLEVPTPGILENFTLRAATRREPGPGEVEIQVCASGLNFKDVLLALGTSPDRPGSPAVRLGMECAGRITALGTGVEDLHVGDEVIALAPSSFSTFVTTPATFAVLKPAHLSFEEAATIPVAFLTAYYAMCHLARLSKGDRVLIHAAAGGVGLAAVRLAQWVGAEIFATAGSPGKREFLRSLGIEHVMDSRSLAFADEVMECTGGQGVDIVLNSLAGEAISKSLSTLRANGRFLEVGIRDIYQNSRLGMGYLRNNVSFFAIDLGPMFIERPDFCGAMLRKLVAYFERGTLKPLPFRVFPISDAQSAFRHMAQAKHIGKIVMSLEEREVFVAPSAEEGVRFRSDGTYLITGGLGGFGLTVAQWMVDQGAQYLVLTGRSSPSLAAQETLEAMRQAGAQVVVAQSDVTQEQEVADVLAKIDQSMPPLRGVVHAAMVLDDASLLELSVDRLKNVMAPKMNGAWNLHTLISNASLDFFVLFSSAVSLAGSPGQANYVAACVFLDQMAHYRRAHGLPALSIDWGRLAEVGYVARHDEVGQRLERLGFAAFTPKQAVTILGRLLERNPVQMAVVRTDWHRWLQTYQAASESPLLSHFKEKGEVSDARGPGSPIHESLLVAKPEERQPLLESYLQQELARVMQLDPSRLNLKKPLNSVGLDSLMGLELKNRIENDLGVDLPMVSLIRDPSISELATQLEGLLPVASFPPSSLTQTLEVDAARVVTDGVSRKDAAQFLAKVDHFSDKEVDLLLREMLTGEDNQ